MVVGTIDFTEADDQIDLPAPKSLNDLQSQSLEQKAAASAPVNMRIEETMVDDALFFNPNAQVPAAQMTTPAPPTPQPTGYGPPSVPYAPSPQPPQSAASPAPYVPRQALDPDEQARIAERAAEQERAKQAQAAVKGNAPMLIRTDYIPRAQAKLRNVAMVICPVCSQNVPETEFQEHLRSEYHAAT